jgi:hypothetical protein
MTAEELRQLFAWCDFKDPIGHPLTMNADFQALVARATANSVRGTIMSDNYGQLMIELLMQILQEQQKISSLARLSGQ